METHQDTIENTITIRSITQECRLRLQECVIRHAGGGGKGESINAPNLARSHWAENRLSDFNLWDAGVGASAAAPNSLDLRLRKDASAKKVVISSLSTLATWATLYRDLADGLEPRARGAGEEDDQPITLEEARLSVEQLLRILVNLGVAIRQSGAISRLGNADGTFQKHKHKYSSLMQHLTFILQLSHLPRAKVPVGDGGATAEMIQVPIASDEQLGPLRFEQQVLIDANAKRRHRFEFARERRDKLKIPVDPQDSAPASSPDAPPDSRLREGLSQSMPAPTGEMQYPTMNAKAPSTEAVGMPPPLSQRSTATTNQLSEFIADVPLDSLVEKLPAAAPPTAIALKADYPSPPKPSFDATGLVCPYCNLTLLSKTARVAQWKKHVSEDLEPYTCYLPDCPQDNRFFNTFKAWKTHVFSDHQVCQGWTCFFCQEPRNFVQESAFSSHVRALHQDAVSEEYLGDLSTVCQIIDEPTLDMCPVCSMHERAWTMKKAGYTQFEPGTDSFLDHIGKCMHDFALRALPSTELDGSVEESSAAPTGAAHLDSRSSLSSVSLGSSTLEKDDRGLKESDLPHVSMYSSHEKIQAWLKEQENIIEYPLPAHPVFRKMPGEPLKLLIAIDFGTTFSRVAYMEIANSLSKRIVSRWDDVEENYVPTVLKYDNGGTSGMFKWGHGALKSLIPGEKLHEWFKLGLNHKVQQDLAEEPGLIDLYASSTALPPVKGRDCEKIVINYLKSLSNAIDKCLTEDRLLSHIVSIEKEYIMTIPGMWSICAKEATAYCAQRALNLTGDDKKPLQVIAEAEAAAIYAVRKKHNSGLRKGDAFIICDAGGGIVDLSSYRVQSLEPSVSLLAVAKASGGLCGSSFLNRIFEDYLRNKLHGHVKRWGAREMRWLKAAVDKWFEHEIKPHFTGEDDEYYLETHALGDDIGIPNNVLEIPGKDIREKIFDPVVRRIQSLVRDQIALTVNRGETVTAVLLAGGFGNNAYLRTCLESVCTDRSVAVRLIHESKLAVVEGALMYGRAKALKKSRAEAIASGRISKDVEYKDEFDTRIMAYVTARLSPAHFGVVRYQTYDPDKHLGDYDLSTLRKDSTGARVVEVMEWFVHQGDELREDEPSIYKLHWAREAKDLDEERFEIVNKIFAYESEKGENPPDYPDSPAHPNSDMAHPFVTIRFVLKIGLLQRQQNNRFWYDERFEVHMVQGSAKISFFLVHNGKRYAPVQVFVPKSL